MNMEQSESCLINLDECLNSILSNYQIFVCDNNNVYKSCICGWIVVMRKLEDTVTNESRKTVIDVDHAKFRANKLLVLKIFNKFDCSKTCETAYSCYGSRVTTYRVGEVVYSDGFDSDLEKICSSGIQYYKTLEAAFYHDVCHGYDGTHKTWYDDGQKRSLTIMKNGGDTCTYTLWYPSGLILAMGTYDVNGKLCVGENLGNDGPYGEIKAWHENGKPNYRCYFANNAWHQNFMDQDGNEIKQNL